MKTKKQKAYKILKEVKEKRRVAIVEMARETHHQEGEVEVDDGAKLAEGAPNGCYVQAWVWVSFEDTPYDKES